MGNVGGEGEKGSLGARLPKASNADPSLEPASCRSSRKHQKLKKCLPHIFRHSPEESEYHEIYGRGENYYFCSLKKNSSFLSIPGGIDKIRGMAFSLSCLQARVSCWPSADFEKNNK